MKNDLKNKLKKELLKSKQLSALSHSHSVSTLQLTTATNSSHSNHSNSLKKPNNFKKEAEIPQRKQVSVGKKVEEKDKRLVPFGKRQMSKLQLKMASKLSGSRFRWINETLYTAKSEESFKLFSKEPELFSIYHKGFASQVSQWPVNPVDIFIKDLQQRETKLEIADLGCGEAAIAQSLATKPEVTVHSFDLVAGNEFITACDIARVPLPSLSIDIAIFCLSLMGTNFVDFLNEANRILKIRGELKVAEVVSRIDDLNEFIKGIEAMGFKLTSKDGKNKMFILLDFIKINSTESVVSRIKHTQDQDLPKLKPCIYKRR